MKKVLIISPHFPPVNAPDMQRLRQSLPYFLENNWQAEVIAVDSDFIEINSIDELLLETIPSTIKVHSIKAFKVASTRKYGLGSLSMRSYFHFKKKGNELLAKSKFDLIFFSTTAFHVMALGPYWKKKFKIPFIVDIQDPWRNDFYLDKPKNERPPKFLISYNIDKYLEAKTIPKADGILSVSDGYIDVFKNRYSNIGNIPTLTLPFAGNKLDFDFIKKVKTLSKNILFDNVKKNVVYIGRGGNDLKKSLSILFDALKEIKITNFDFFSTLHFWFIGTSYAEIGKGIKTIYPVAKKFGVEEIVTEITDRLPYFETLYWLKQADLLFVPGSTDTAYTASKIYSYILADKPLLAIFHKNSSVVKILKETNCGYCLTFDDFENSTYLISECRRNLNFILCQSEIRKTNWDEFDKYSAKNMTKIMISFFDIIVK